MAEPYRPGFDPQRALTWNAEEKATWNDGFESGEDSGRHDWTHALDDVVPDEVLDGGPYEVRNYIAALQAAASGGLSKPS